MVTRDDDRYLNLVDLMHYAGLSLSTLKRRLKGANPIPHARISGRILVRRSAFDAWVAAQTVVEQPPTPSPVERDAAQILASIRGGRQ